jgi:hypothetical protein
MKMDWQLWWISLGYVLLSINFIEATYLVRGFSPDDPKAKTITDHYKNIPALLI